MRISNFETNSIVFNTKKIFGHQARVYLFGNRVDDSKKGGDIDLYIIHDNSEDMHQKKIQSLLAVKKILDPYLYRFYKLQDAIGEKLFKLLLNRFEDNSETLSFIDILNKLKKIGIISSADEWKVLRQLKNDLAHEYEDDPDEVAGLHNLVFSKKPIIEDIYKKLKGYVERGYHL